VLEGLTRQKTGEPFSHDYRIRRPSGDVRWIWDRGFPVRSADGQVTHYVGVAEDITERRLAEQRTKLQHEVTSVLAEAGTVGETNRKLLALLGNALDLDLGEVWLVDRVSNLRLTEVWHSASPRLAEFA
jgi:hypothetical protein